MSKKVKRCNLCGAKLSGDVCGECGYNNAAYSYDVNDRGEYCTHSSSEQFFDEEDHWKHMDPEIEMKDKWDYSQIEEQDDNEFEKQYDSQPNKAPVTYGLNEKRRKKKKSGRGKLFWIVLMIWLVSNGIGILRGIVEGIIDDYGESYRDYDSVTEAVTEEEDAEKTRIVYQDGKEFEARLHSGNYVAGVQIPVGIYQVNWVSGDGFFRVWNPETYYWESLYMYETDSDEKQNLQEVELTEGTMLQVEYLLAVDLTTEDSEGYVERKENSLTETIKVEDGMKAGIDFPAGTYRAICENGAYHSSLLIKHYSAAEYEMAAMVEFPEGRSEYQNLILTEGDLLVTINGDITLEPAEYDLSDYADSAYD